MELTARERFWRRWALALGLAALAAAALAARLWWELRRAAVRETPAVTEAAEPPPDRLVLAPASYAALPGWNEDRLADALPALRASCGVFGRRPPERPLGEGGLTGRLADWRDFCDGLAGLAGDDASLRAHVEGSLVPFEVTNRGDATGLFTGYYEPTLRGSRRPSERFRIPLHLRPPELVSVDLGVFREELRGQRIAGRVAGGVLEPFFDRAAIDRGALAGRGLELVWVDSAVDAFFLHIQGSGRVELAEGGFLRLGYASQNGHPYRAIGRELVERGEMTLEEVSMQSIRAWLESHPDRAGEVMATNASYVFFRRLDEPGPVGSLGVVLTPGRSLAVDRTFLPLGPPLWLDATAPDADPAAPDRPLRRLVVAQDTGGAIRGPVRGDLFWGPGAEAAEIAGRMKHEGRLWLLLPRSVDPLAATAIDPAADAP